MASGLTAIVLLHVQFRPPRYLAGDMKLEAGQHKLFIEASGPVWIIAIQRLASFYQFPRKAMIYQATKVFGIGHSKTGTSSLNRALNQLGIPSIHYPHDPVTFRQLRKGDFRLSVLERNQGVTDIPVAPFYRQLDGAFPGAKFILTVRDENRWLDSIANHWLFMQEWTARNDRFRRFNDFIVARVYGTNEFHREHFLQVYLEHEAAVRRYFAGRSNDLLVLDVCGGNAWDSLCEFLGVSAPARVFPHANRREGVVHSRSWVERLDEAVTGFRTAVPPLAPYILFDEYQLGGSQVDDPTRARRIVERDRKYWGYPKNSEEAIGRLEALRESGAQFAVIAWPSAWWLEHYRGFAEHLESNYKRCLTSASLSVFDLAPQ